MDEDVLRALAIAAAGAIVRAMGSANWIAVRDRWARVLGRGDATEEAAVGGQLDETAASLREGADRSDAEREALAEWRGALRALLRNHPELVDAIRVETAADPASVAARTDSISQVASVHGGMSIQSGRDTTLT